MHIITIALSLNLQGMDSAMVCLPQEIHNQIASFLRQLIYKDLPFDEEWIPLKRPLQTFNYKIDDQNILQYYKVDNGEAFCLTIDDFKIHCTTTQPYGHFLNAHIRHHDLRVLDKNKQCIIQHRCPEQVSFIEIQNNILTAYYNRKGFMGAIASAFTQEYMRADSWLLCKRKETNYDTSTYNHSPFNCFKLALFYHASFPLKKFLSPTSN